MSVKCFEQTFENYAHCVKWSSISRDHRVTLYATQWGRGTTYGPNSSDSLGLLRQPLHPRLSLPTYWQSYQTLSYTNLDGNITTFLRPPQSSIQGLYSRGVSVQIGYLACTNIFLSEGLIFSRERYRAPRGSGLKT